MSVAPPEDRRGQAFPARASSNVATEVTLSTLEGKFGDLGQQAAAASAPVVLASDQPAIPVTVASISLPTGAATEATLSAINGKIPSLGQALMAASLPVVLASNQSALPVTLTSTTITGTVTTTVSGPVAVTGTFWQATQPVSIAGSVAVTGPLTDAQLRATAVPVSLVSTTITGSVAVTGPLTDTQLRATPVPVSGAVTTGGLTDTQLRASAVAVTGPTTNAELRATALPVSLSADNPASPLDLLMLDTLNAILAELQVHSLLLQTGLSVNDDLSELREGFTETLN